jgi:methylmalonyl-CoA/ethylmalonyl-CoA epimerase
MTEHALGTNLVMQVGIVVRDIEARAHDWSRILGLPRPDIIITDPVEIAHTEYQGQPSPARAKLAFFRMGQVAVELIEPLGAPSTWQDQLDAHGDSIHHIAFQIEGMTEKLAYLASNGMPLLQRGDYTGGRYAYVDGAAQLGLVLELLENDRREET